jgi:hypothetical protein
MKPKEPPTPNAAKEPGIPVQVPISIIRWLSYSLFIGALLAPGMKVMTWQLWLGLSLTVGHISGQLNAIINKTK